MKALKLCIILLTITFVSCTKKTQTTNSRNDSVEKYLQLASIDTLPMETRKTYNKKAFSFIDLEKNDTAIRWYLCQTALNYSILKDSLNYYKVSNLHLKKANEANDTLNLARFYRYRGGFHRKVSNKMDSAFYFYTKSEKLYKKIKDSQNLSLIYLFKGIVLYEINDFSTSELYYQKCENILKEKINYNILLDLNCQKGLLFSRKLDHNKAIYCFKKGLKVLENKKALKDSLNMSILLSNIAESYLAMNNKKKGQFYLKKAIRFSKLIKIDPILYHLLKINLLNTNPKSINKNSFEKAYLDFLKVSKETNSISDIYNALIELSNLYHKNGNLIEAQKYANEALFCSKKTKAPYDIMNAWKQIGIVDKERASEAIIQFDIQVDSLLNKERRERSKFLKIQLETDEITQEKEKAIKQKWVQTSIIATVLLIVILLFIIFKQRSQKKEFVLIQNQQKANEEIYQLMLNQQAKEEEAKQKEKKRIALELHDNVMNKLASTRFNLFALTQKQDDPTLQNAVQHIDKIKDIEDEIRNITHELSKETFSKSNSFTSLLAQLIEQQNQLHPSDFNLEIDPKINWDAFASEIKMNYYRIIQEAIHNTNKYAKATKSTVSLLLEENKLRLSISDNGVGFETNTTKQGIGIQNMQQRITAINGDITINSAPGKGTVINCSVVV